MAEPTPTEGEALPPDDAFALLGNETRMAILRALWEGRDPLAPAAENAMSFTDLREQVGATDPGRFNYHLNQLVGPFVRRTEAGYLLRRNATGVLRAVVTGSLSSDGDQLEFETADPCPLCGADVEVRYSNPTLTVRCTSCEGEYRSSISPEGTLMTSAVFPPMGVENRDGQALWEALTDHLATRAFGFLREVCPVCAAPPVTTIDSCADHDPAGICDRCGSTQPVLATMHCEHCTLVWRFPAWVAAMTHPEVIWFFHERGADANAGLTLDIYNRFLTSQQTVRATDPLELEAVVTVRGDELAVTIDENLDVTVEH